MFVGFRFFIFFIFRQETNLLDYAKGLTENMDLKLERIYELFIFTEGNGVFFSALYRKNDVLNGNLAAIDVRKKVDLILKEVPDKDLP